MSPDRDPDPNPDRPEPRRWITAALLGGTVLAVLVAPRLAPRADAGATPPAVPPATAAVASIEELAVPAERVPAEDAPSPVAGSPLPADPPARLPAPARRDVDVVICLDTSGSMEDLLDSARARLWDIVGGVARAEPGAHLRVALLTFGSEGTEEDGYVLLRSDLTSDLDAVYAELMGLTTLGGDEYVGWTLHTAATRLSWSPSADAARIVFVAGNESADQGREGHDFRTVTADLRERGVIVNAVYAGAESQGRQEQWEELARHGGGAYSSIDASRATRQISAPQDQRLQELNRALNETYLSYGGVEGEKSKERQAAQDANAGRLGSLSLSSRIAAKASALYDNSEWDLVDGLQRGKVDLSAASGLPAPVAALPEADRRAYVEGLMHRRAELKNQIQDLQSERERYLDQAVPEAEEVGFDEAVVKALEAQL